MKGIQDSSNNFVPSYVLSLSKPNTCRNYCQIYWKAIWLTFDSAFNKSELLIGHPIFLPSSMRQCTTKRFFIVSPPRALNARDPFHARRWTREELLEICLLFDLLPSASDAPRNVRTRQALKQTIFLEAQCHCRDWKLFRRVVFFIFFFVRRASLFVVLTRQTASIKWPDCEKRENVRP